MIRIRTARHYSRPILLSPGCGPTGVVMSAQIETTCPNCAKKLKVPEAALGRLIRCKACDATFEVPDPNAKPKAAKPALVKPTAAKPTIAKAKVPAAPVEAPKGTEDPNAPLGFAKDDDDDDDDSGPPKVMNVVIEGEEARCPHCAKELDPPDTLICMNCGYDLVERRRHASKKIYEQTGGDYFKHWLPAILWGFMMVMMTTVFIICCVYMGRWFEGSIFEKDDKNPTTNLPEYYLPPGACLMCCFIIWAPVMANGIRMFVKKIKNPKPAEIEKKDD